MPIYMHIKCANNDNYRAISINMHFISAYLENSVFLEYVTLNLQKNDFLQI